jgi:ferritin-like protein
MSDDATYLHESTAALSVATLDNHRAYRSLIEELEAIDWYAQRVEAGTDAQLKAVLAHNGNEEKEHAAMVLEWLRRRDPVLDRHLRAYLFTNEPIEERETEPESPADGGGARNADLGIGSLKERDS